MCARPTRADRDRPWPGRWRRAGTSARSTCANPAARSPAAPTLWKASRSSIWRATRPRSCGRLLARADVDCVALGLRTVHDPGLGHVAEALLEQPLGAAAPGEAGHAPAHQPAAPPRAARGHPIELRSDASTPTRRCARRGREIVMLHVVTGDDAGAKPAACRRRASSIRSTTSGPPGRTSSPCASRQCPRGRPPPRGVRVGEPASTIVAEARAGDAELIVLSWGGTFTAGHGLIVRRLLETAPCPLLVVPADGIDGLLARGCSREQ